ncbi:hypothetical protein Bca52824_009717 [Brassica carinata]|uniref:Uncharacterized protein n=1 Tax=Brassica carinata TaxID=52824 RepID=A0A8X7WC82_BRACI|nr:hypothetical protein Bca52824_009717 [Brassica carinata]
MSNIHFVLQSSEQNKRILHRSNKSSEKVTEKQNKSLSVYRPHQLMNRAAQLVTACHLRLKEQSAVVTNLELKKLLGTLLNVIKFEMDTFPTLFIGIET